MSKEAVPEEIRPCVSRRQFLLSTGGVTATTVFLSSLPGFFGEVQAQVVEYPRRKIARLSAIEQDVPIYFKYPDDHPFNAASMLVKLGEPAGMGVGPDNDIVAFNALCPHMGGMMTGTYVKEHKVLGPCPLHLTTFDLTRHGMVVAGHATESLPQVLLEVQGGDVYATGIMGLIYGKRDSLDQSAL